MTQLEHYMYIKVLFDEAECGVELDNVYEEIQTYCRNFNANFLHTVALL